MDLKVENHRLQRKVMYYKSRVPPASSSQAAPMYATSSLHPPSRNLSTQGINSQQVSDPSSSFDQPGSNFTLDFPETLYDSNLSHTNLEEASEGSKKKVSTDSIISICLLNDNGLS